MQGVTTAIVVFIFAAMIFPKVIKNRPQFYAAVCVVILIVILDGIAQILPSYPDGQRGFRAFAYVTCAFLQAGAILILIMSAGGLSVKDLAGDMAETIEVIRRGDTTKTVIVPLKGEVPKPRGEPGPVVRESVTVEDDIRPEEIDAAAARAAAAPRPAPPKEDRSIPLE